ncbi:hypothetical protein YC2023_030180 [Brassica napus]
MHRDHTYGKIYITMMLLALHINGKFSLVNLRDSTKTSVILIEVKLALFHIFLKNSIVKILK